MKILILLTLISNLALAESFIDLEEKVDLDRIGSEHSCSRGNPNGCYNLAVDLYNQNKKPQALLKFKEICAQHFAKACFQAARVYVDSGKDSSNLKEAYYWISLAIDYGLDAREAKLKIERKLNLEDLNEVKSRLLQKYQNEKKSGTTE